MPLHEILDRSKPGFALAHFPLGMLLAGAALGLAWLTRPAAISPEQWVPFVVVALSAAGAAGILEKGSASGAGATFLPAMSISLGFALAITLAVMLLPGNWSPGCMDSVAERMPIAMRTQAHELADGPEIYGRYLMAIGVVALAGAFFGSVGALFVTLLHVMGWAVMVGGIGRAGGGVPGGLGVMARTVGAASPYLLPAFLGLLAAGVGSHQIVQRFIGGKGSDAGTSTRPAALMLLAALLLALLAGSVELFGGGMLAGLLGK